MSGCKKFLGKNGGVWEIGKVRAPLVGFKNFVLVFLFLDFLYYLLRINLIIKKGIE